MIDKIDSVSKYRVMMFDICKLKYKLVCINEVQGVQNVLQQAGTDFHKDTEKFFKCISLDDLIEIRSYNEVLNYMKEQTVHKGFAKFEAVRWWKYYRERDPDEYMPLFLELKLDSPPYRGIIDRVQLFQKNVILFEYKRTIPAKIKQEMAFYTHLFNQVEPEGYKATHGAVFAYDPKPDSETGMPKEWDFDMWKIHTRSLTAMAKKVNLLIAMTNNVDKVEWTHNDTFCPYCDISHACPVAQGEMDEDIKWDDKEAEDIDWSKIDV